MAHRKRKILVARGTTVVELLVHPPHVRSRRTSWVQECQNVARRQDDRRFGLWMGGAWEVHVAEEIPPTRRMQVMSVAPTLAWRVAKKFAKREQVEMYLIAMANRA